MPENFWGACKKETGMGGVAAEYHIGSIESIRPAPHDTHTCAFKGGYETP